MLSRGAACLGSSAARHASFTTTCCATTVTTTVNELIELYKSPIGHSNYDPFCTQLEHGLQTMLRARECGADSTMQMTAFLHDIGHLVLNEHVGADGFLAEDLQHEVVGAEHLAMLGFPPSVTEPIRLHVPAKRYLCHVDPQYWEALSAGSKASLELQGGVMSAAEADAYIRENGTAGEAAATLRRWEDEGKTLFSLGDRSPVTFDADIERDLSHWMSEAL